MMIPSVPNFIGEDFEARHQKARQLMAAHSIDVILLAGGASLRYYTGLKFHPNDRLTMIALPQKGSPFLICPLFEEESLAEKIVYGNEHIFTWQEFEDPFQLTAKVLKDKGLRSIGIDESLPFWQFDEIRKAYPTVSFHNAAKINYTLRAIKSPKEIACLRAATEISLIVHERALKQIYAGMKMSELERIYADLHLSMGAERPWGGGSFGIASSFIHGTIQDIELQEGMVILADAGATVQGYFSDISRTIVFGKANQEIKDAWEVAQISQLAGMEALQAGSSCESVDLAIRKVIEKAGYKPSYTFLPHRVGHGLGLEIHEPPYLVEGNKELIQPGMTFAFDGAFYIEGKFGVRLEDNFLVTENGIEIFGNKIAKSMDQVFG